MTRRLLRTAAAACLALGLALHAFAQTIAVPNLPAIPIGATIHIQFTLTANGSPLPAIAVTLTPVNGCGTIGGSSTSTVTTDASGTAGFDFTAGVQPGGCRIEGRNGSTVAAIVVTVFNPADVMVTDTTNYARRWSQVFITPAGTAGSLLAFSIGARDAKGKGIGLGNVPVTVEVAPSDDGASGTVTLDRPTTDSFARNPNAYDGYFTVRLQPNGKAGIYDLLFHVGGAVVPFRIWQSAIESPGNVMYLPLRFEGMTAALVNPPPGCMLSFVAFTSTSTSSMPASVAEWVDGQLSINPFGCTVPFQVRINYSHPVPPGATFFWNGPGTWVPLPTVVSGTSATVTIDPAKVNGQVNGGVGVPGTWVPAYPIRVKDLWWSGPEENGWGMSIMQSADNSKIFPVLFAYDDKGNPSWWAMDGGWDMTARTYDVVAIHPRGTPWYAYAAALEVNGDNAGKATLTFTDASHASFAYGIDGRSGQKSLQRQQFGPGSASNVPDVGGMWWGGSTQYGWGIAVAQQASTLFCVWYTYDDRGYPTWVVMPGGTWTSASSYEGRVYRTHSSGWLGQAYDRSKLTVTDVGSYRFRFNGTGATFDYTIDGRSGTLSLSRQPPF